MRYLIFLFLSGCSYHNCSLNPGLTSLLANPNKKTASVDIVQLYTDPIQNVSAVAKCSF